MYNIIIIYFRTNQQYHRNSISLLSGALIFAKIYDLKLQYSLKFSYFYLKWIILGLY